MMTHFNVAYCGLYCGACKSFTTGKCPGCYSNDKATWCKIRQCCSEQGYATCADCQIMPLKACKKYNNIFAKIIGFLTQTDRSKCIDCIKTSGVEQFAATMEASHKMSLKKP